MEPIDQYKNLIKIPNIKDPQITQISFLVGLGGRLTKDAVKCKDVFISPTPSNPESNLRNPCNLTPEDFGAVDLKSSVSGMPNRSIRPHYLLKIDTAAISCDGNSFDVGVPASIRRELEETNFVVVRRGVVTENWVPIGIRGPQRSQRWAAWYPRYAIQEIVKPMDLLPQVDTVNLRDISPPRRALRALMKTWQWLTYPWGPGGSLGFEVATGRQTTTLRSDLDVVIYADEPLSRRDAQRLLAAADDLEVSVDIRIETPTCGFSLAEYATSPTKKILLRTVTGPILGDDPWDQTLCTTAPR